MSERTVKVNLVAHATGYVSGMDAAAKKTREVGSEAQKLAEKARGIEMLGKAGVAVGVAIVGIGAAALSTGIQYNTLQQTARAALTTILGSASAAADQMDRLDDFARKSPFAKQTFISAQQQMLAFGIETKKVIPYLGAVQDAVAAAGGSNVEIEAIVSTMSKIQSASKLTGQDLIEFGNRGINAAELIGSQMGKTGAEIRGEITDGALDATVALDALAAGMAERFGGAAANVKQTFEGSIDRVKAAWRDFSSELAKPLVDPNGGGALIDLFNWTADMMRGFQALPAPIKETTATLVGVVGVAALTGGTMLLAVPKIAQFRANMAALNMTGKSMVGTFAKSGALMLAITAAIGGLANMASQTELTEEQIARLNAAFKTGELDKFTDQLRLGGMEGDNLKGALDALTGSDYYSWQRDVNEGTTKFMAGIPLLGELFKGLENDIGRNEAAFRQYGRQLATTATTDFAQASSRFKEMQVEAGGTDEATKNLLETMPEYKATLIDLAAEMGVTLTEQQLLNLATGDSVLANSIAAKGSRENKSTLSDLAGQSKETKREIEGLSDELRDFGKTTFDVIDAERDFYEALDAVTERLGEDGFAGGLSQANEAGRLNMDVLKDIARGTSEYGAATYDATGSTDALIGVLSTGRQKLIDAALSFGATREEAEKYADQLIVTPEVVRTRVELDTNKAQAALDNWITTAQGRTVRIAMGAGGSGGMVVGSAQGNLFERGVKAFYQGGFASGIYNGVQGGIHKFAEKEMGVPWEAYISGRASDRERNIGIWAETGSRLGAMQTAPVMYSGSGGGPSSVSLAGATIVMEVEGRQMTAMIREQAVQVTDQRFDHHLGRQHAANAGRR